MELTKEQIWDLYGELQYTKRVSPLIFYLTLSSEELNFLMFLVKKELEKVENGAKSDIKEEYKINYEELSLTGNIPKHPKYLYEYELPKDFKEFKTQVPYTDDLREKATDCIIYLNNEQKLVLASNFTPLVIGYKPKNI